MNIDKNILSGNSPSTMVFDQTSYQAELCLNPCRKLLQDILGSSNYTLAKIARECKIPSSLLSKLLNGFIIEPTPYIFNKLLYLYCYITHSNYLA